MAKAVSLDFTKVKDGGGDFNKKHYPPGDYLGKVLKVEDAKVKSGDNEGDPMWLFTIQVQTGKYPYYCKFDENQVWKIRNLFIAAGINVPKSRLKVDPAKVIGKNIGVTLEDDEYKDKINSIVASIFPPSELNGDGGAADADDEETEDSAPKKAKKAKAEESEPEESPKKKSKKSKKNKGSLEALDIEDI